MTTIMQIARLAERMMAAFSFTQADGSPHHATYCITHTNKDTCRHGYNGSPILNYCSCTPVPSLERKRNQMEVMGSNSAADRTILLRIR